MQYMTEQEIDNIASETGRLLKKEKKVALIVRAEHGEPYWEDGINGHFFRIRTETPVSVPESLAKLIAASRQVREVSKRKLRAFEDAGVRIG